jgi:hypothetical protein
MRQAVHTGGGARSLEGPETDISLNNRRQQRFNEAFDRD